MKFKLNYKTFGVKAVLIEWPERIGLDVLDDILSLKYKLDNQLNDVLELVVGYNSLTVIFKHVIKNEVRLFEHIDELYQVQNESLKQQCVRWDIPVCYDVEFGIDLQDVSQQLQIRIPEIIEKHSVVEYTVYFIGFLPGFLYLGGLDSDLHLARKSTPRLNVFKGAVAIGGSQTGVYPNASAGGWHIIGKTPISFFDISKKSPCFAKSGDKISFKPISVSEFKQMEEDIRSGKFKLKPVSHD